MLAEWKVIRLSIRRIPAHQYIFLLDKIICALTRSENGEGKNEESELKSQSADCRRSPNEDTAL